MDTPEEYAITLTEGYTIYAHSELTLAFKYAEAKHITLWAKMNPIDKGNHVEKALEHIRTLPVTTETINGVLTHARTESPPKPTKLKPKTPSAKDTRNV